MKLFVTKVNGWKLSSILDFVVGLDTSLILVNYKNFFYSLSLSITINSLISLSQSEGAYLVVLLLLFQNSFLYHLPHYFYHFQTCQVFCHSSQVVAPRRAPLHIRVIYIVACVFFLLENLTTFRYH